MKILNLRKYGSSRSELFFFAGVFSLLILGTAALVVKPAILEQLMSPKSLKFIVILIGLVLSVISKNKTKILLGLLVLSPAINFEIKAGENVLTFVDLVLVLFLMNAFNVYYKFRSKFEKVKFEFYFIYLGVIISFLVGDKNLDSIFGTLRWIAIISLILFFMANVRQSIISDHIFIGKIFVISSLLCGIFGIAQKRGINIYVGTSYANDRIDSTFQYYSNYSSFLATCLPIALYFVLSRESSRFWKVTSTIASLIIFEEVVTNYSRGAMATVALSIGLTSIMFRKRFLLVSGIGFSLLITGIFFLPRIQNSEIFQIYQERFAAGNGSDRSRFLLQNSGFELAKQNLLGIGSANFAQELESGIVVSRLALAHPHSLYISIALELGLIGLVGFLILILRALIMRSEKSEYSDVLIRGSFLIAFICQLFQGFFDYFFNETASALLFALVAGVSLQKTNFINYRTRSNHFEFIDTRPDN